MIKVLHVLDHSLPMHSGYTFRTRAILKAQQRLGIAVRGITGLRHTLPGPGAETEDGLLFHRTAGEVSGLPGLREWREINLFADAIGKLVEEWRPDVIHAHSPALCGQAAMRVARREHIPFIYEIRAFWEDAAVGNGVTREGSLRYRLTRQLENHVVRHADRIVTICEGLRGDLIARGTPPERIAVAPNGVDLTLFGTPPAPDMALAHELGLVDAHGELQPVIGFIGSFYDYEGLDVLIDAMPLLVRQQPQAKLLLVGGGPCEGDLRARAAASPAASAIRFVGRVPHAGGALLRTHPGAGLPAQAQPADRSGHSAEAARDDGAGQARLRLGRGRASRADRGRRDRPALRARRFAGLCRSARGHARVPGDMAGDARSRPPPRRRAA
jgi:glycogen synthase